MKNFNKVTLCAYAVLIALLSFQSGLRAEDVLWKSGANLYIKLDKQDQFKKGDTPANQHPVTLNANKIANALNLIRIWDRHLFKKDELKTLFSLEQARLLGQYLSEGLAKAGPDQDIIFSVPRREKKLVIIQNLFYTTGRAFYADNRLHIIIGEFEKPPDKFKERTHQSSGISEVKYYFNHGRRAKKSKFDLAIVGKPGLGNHKDGEKVRQDWLVIDIEQASTTYLAENTDTNVEGSGPNDAVISEEAAKLARERREMRLEMARLRKEMRDEDSNGGDKDTSSVEERLQRLEQLKQKQLVTEEEYQAKRSEILSDL